jgi:hypothetical protein
MGLCTFSLALIAASGCSTTSNQGNAMKLAAADPPEKSVVAPDVSHCALVTISSPVLYACNGKVYSEHKLARLREEARRQKAREDASKKPATNSGGAANGQGNSSANANSTAGTSASSKM